MNDRNFVSLPVSLLDTVEVLFGRLCIGVWFCYEGQMCAKSGELSAYSVLGFENKNIGPEEKVSIVWTQSPDASLEKPR